MYSLWGLRVNVKDVLSKREELIKTLEADEAIELGFLVEVLDNKESYFLNKNDTGLLLIAGRHYLEGELIQNLVYSNSDLYEDYKTIKELFDKFEKCRKELANAKTEEEKDKAMDMYMDINVARRVWDISFEFIEFNEFGDVKVKIDNVVKGGTETDLKLVENLYIESL